MSSLSTACPDLTRRRRLTLRALVGRARAVGRPDQREIDRLVELERLAASLPRDHRPQNPRDLYVRYHRLPPIV